MSAVEEWAEQFSQQMDQAEQYSYQTLQEPATPAIFTPVHRAVADYEQGKQERKIDRAKRRYQRRETLGQPQRVDDLRINAQKGAL